jgi:SPP1 family predicted phage head-tail adaptor
MAHRLPTTISPGELRHRIQIAVPSGAQDSMGGISQNPANWTVGWTCWASIEAWTGSQSLGTDQFVSESSHWITIRNPREAFTVTSAMYVWWGGRTFQITAVLNPTEQNKLLVLVCAEINDSQQEVPTPVVA